MRDVNLGKTAPDDVRYAPVVFLKYSAGRGRLQIGHCNARAAGSMFEPKMEKVHTRRKVDQVNVGIQWEGDASV